MSSPPVADSKAPFAVPPAVPRRPRGLTAWLIVLIVFNVLAAVVMAVVGAGYRSLAPDTPSTSLLFGPTVLSAANIAFAIVLLKNRKWGFWGLCASALLYMPATYVLGAGVGGALGVGLFGFIGVGILYLLLNTDEPNARTWPRLR